MSEKLRHAGKFFFFFTPPPSSFWGSLNWEDAPGLLKRRWQADRLKWLTQSCFSNDLHHRGQVPLGNSSLALLSGVSVHCYRQTTGRSTFSSLAHSCLSTRRSISDGFGRLNHRSCQEGEGINKWRPLGLQCCLGVLAICLVFRWDILDDPKCIQNLISLCSISLAHEWLSLTGPQGQKGPAHSVFNIHLTFSISSFFCLVLQFTWLLFLKSLCVNSCLNISCGRRPHGVL